MLPWTWIILFITYNCDIWTIVIVGVPPTDPTDEYTLRFEMPSAVPEADDFHPQRLFHTDCLFI